MCSPSTKSQSGLKNRDASNREYALLWNRSELDFGLGGVTRRLSLKGLTIAGGLLWGGAILFLGLINIVRPLYGANFLQAISSVYPWFHASRSFVDVLIGTVDALIDGAIAGFLFGWLYNLSVRNPKQT